MIKCYEQERTGTHHIPRTRPAYVSQEKIALVPDKAVGIIKHALASCESVKRSGFGSFVMKDVPLGLFCPTHLEKYTTSKGTKRISFVPFRMKQSIIYQPAHECLLRKLGTTGRITDNKCRLKINSSGIFLSIIIRITQENCDNDLTTTPSAKSFGHINTKI